MKNFKGYTLAEVLITIGIIGTVAAITIPNLIKSYQKYMWVNQLKRSVSVLENGLKLALAHEGVDSLYDTKIFSFYDQDLSNSEREDFFISEISKYFKIVKNLKEYSYKNKYKCINGDAIEDFYVSHIIP